MKAYMRVSSNAQVGFTNSARNDLLFFTDSNTQRILMGTKQNQLASFAITSNSVIINENLGIGTSNPEHPLHVIGTSRFDTLTAGSGNAAAPSMTFVGDTDTGVFRPTADTLALATGGAERVRLDATGRLGVGTGVPAARLHARGEAMRGLLVEGAYGWTSVTLSNSVANTDIGLASGAGDFILDSLSGDLIVNQSATRRIQMAINGTSAMCINSNANVGIGTTTPSYRLDVSGAARISSNLDVGLDGTPGIIRLGGPAGDTPFNHAVITTRLYGATDLSELVIFKGNDTVQDRIRLRAAQLVFDTYPTNTDDFTATNPRMVISSSGNVGIGTMSPAALLEVANSVLFRNSVLVNNTTANNAPHTVMTLRREGASGVSWPAICDFRIGKYSTEIDSRTQLTINLQNQTDGEGPVTVMTLNGNGNVGIGTTAPSQRLDVSGSIRAFDGTIQARFLTITQNPTGGPVDFVSISQRGGISTGWNTANEAPIYLGKSTSTSRTINAAGTLNANGTDYAEYMEKSDHSIIIAKGDIVGIDSNGKLTTLFDQAVRFVIKSTDPSFVGGDKWEGSTPPEPVYADFENDEAYLAAMAHWRSECDLVRLKYDRIAYSGQVPVNITDASPGDYIVPQSTPTGGITGISVPKASLTMDQYLLAVGVVIKILQDGRAHVIVKVA